MGDLMSKRPKSLSKRRLERGDEQVPTSSVSIREIMTSPKFAQGVADVRAGKPFPLDYDEWADQDDTWSYERGRHWAAAVPRSVPLQRDGKVTGEAIHWFVKMDIL
jgi:hypothetical protein